MSAGTGTSRYADAARELLDRYSPPRLPEVVRVEWAFDGRLDVFVRVGPPADQWGARMRFTPPTRGDVTVEDVTFRLAVLRSQLPERRRGDLDDLLDALVAGRR